METRNQNIFYIIFSSGGPRIRGILMRITLGRAYALSRNAPREREKKNHRLRTPAIQPPWIRECLDSADHGRRGTHARRLLQLLQKQKRSLRRSLRVFLHRSGMEKLLARCPRRSVVDRCRTAGCASLSLAPALRGC